jgi:hypothetical protein
MTTYLCDLCGKPYRSKRGLRDHQKSHHQATEGLPLTMPLLDKEKTEPLSLALEALGIDPSQVMDFKVYADQVVIIEGPVGFKRIWTRC